MDTYVALLRGINVGGHNIKMESLKSSFQKLDLMCIKTILQSGNVIFNSSKKGKQLKQEIENKLLEEYEYVIKTQIIDMLSLEKIINKIPFENNEDRHNYVIFFENGLENELYDEISKVDLINEKIFKGNGCIYWNVSKGMTLKSNFSKYLNKAKYKPFNTNRNISTLIKIINKKVKEDK